MAAVALGLYLTYLLLTFGLRSLLHYRHTGSTGFHGPGGKPGSWEWCGGLLFALTLLLGLAGPTLQLLDLIHPFTPLDTIPIGITGLVLTIAGITATLAAQHTMGTSWRIGVDRAETTTLITRGVFAQVRNPVFTAMMLAAIGLTLQAPNPITLAGLAALVIAIEIQVRAVEEPYLQRTHDQTYHDYAAHTGRFLPRIGQLTLQQPNPADR